MFKCDKCGECCRNLNKSSLYIHYMTEMGYVDI